MGLNGRKVSAPKGFARKHKQKLREEAEVRQVARDLRSTEEQLKLIDSRRGSSLREKTRLERQEK